jgi:hypothetical protein
LPVAMTITGVMFIQVAQGNFTGDNTNAIGLYTYSGGVITKQRETADDANIWKGTANTFRTVPFASTYAASAGIHYIVALYNNSAQTAAPTVAAVGAGVNGAITTLDFTNSARIHATLSGQTSLPATITFPGATAVQNFRPVFALY